MYTVETKTIKTSNEITSAYQLSFEKKLIQEVKTKQHIRKSKILISIHRK